jgi:crossover junction endodeoxyribonuclease RuvC
MRVFGIDPGSLVTGYGVVEEQGNRLQALAWGTVRTSSKHVLSERLKRIYDGLTEPLQTWQPDAVSVEQVFFCRQSENRSDLGSRPWGGPASRGPCGCATR